MTLATSLPPTATRSGRATAPRVRGLLAAHRNDALIVLALGAAGGVSQAASTMYWFVGNDAIGVGHVFAAHLIPNTLACIVIALVALWLERRKLEGWRHVASIAAAVLVLATANASRTQWLPLIQRGMSDVEAAVYQFWHSLLLATLAFAYFARRRAQDESAERLAAVQAEQRAAARRVASARLQSLTARVDPQLLFDLLDSVQRAYAVDPRRAERLLDELTLFLRAALSRLHLASSTVAQECELAASYARMRNLAGNSAGHVEMTLDAAAQARFPPGVILPIAEDLLREGGNEPIALRATLSQGRCKVSIVSSRPPGPSALARAREMLELDDEASAIEVLQHEGSFVTTMDVAHDPV